MNTNKKRKQNMNDTYTAPFVRGSDTSQAAAKSIQSDVNRLRQLVLEVITRAGVDGVTCDSTEEVLALSHQTCSPRFTELKKLGVIVDSGRRRRTRSNRSAVVYVLAKLAGAPVQGGPGPASKQ